MLQRKTKKANQTPATLRGGGTALQATVLSHPSTISALENLEDWQFLPLSLYREGGVRVVDDGGAGGLGVELPLLWDPRGFGACSRRAARESKGRPAPPGPRLANRGALVTVSATVLEEAPAPPGSRRVLFWQVTVYATVSRAVPCRAEAHNAQSRGGGRIKWTRVGQMPTKGGVRLLTST